jgi:hypothetical protein
MRSIVALLLLSLAACGSSSSDDDAPANGGAQRDTMRSEVEGTWTGAYTFTDGRAPTTMTLALSYSGNGQTTPQCGMWTLSNEPSGVGPRCITLYSLPLRGTLTTADGARKGEAVALSYSDFEGLSGGTGAASIKAGLKQGLLEGTAGGGSFVLTRSSK